MRVILSVLDCVVCRRARGERLLRAIRSGAGLPIGRRSDGGRRHGRRRERHAGARSPRAGIHRHRRRPAAAGHQRRVHLRQLRASVEPAKPRDPYVSNNTDRRPGRLIMLVIDRNNIDTHTIRDRRRRAEAVRHEHRAGRPAVARDHSAARADRSTSRPTTRRCSTPSRASSGRTTRCSRGSTSATTRPSRSRIDRIRSRRSGCCIARAATPTRTRCRRAIVTSSRKR